MSNVTASNVGRHSNLCSGLGGIERSCIGGGCTPAAGGRLGVRMVHINQHRTARRRQPVEQTHSRLVAEPIAREVLWLRRT